MDAVLAIRSTSCFQVAKGQISCGGNDAAVFHFLAVRT